MNTVSKAFIAAIIFSLAFVGGFLLGSNKEVSTKIYETPSQSSVIIIDSAGGNSISVTQGGISDSGEVTKQQLERAFKVGDVFVPKVYKVIKYKGMYSVLMPGGSIFYHFKTKQEAESTIEKFILQDKAEWDENKKWEYNNKKVNQ